MSARSGIERGGVGTREGSYDDGYESWGESLTITRGC